MQFNLYTAEPESTTALSYFYGINRTRRPKRGEFEAMKNMSSSEYPCISPRGRRESVATVSGKISAVCAPDLTNTTDITAFTGIADGSFWYNGVKKSKSVVLADDRSWEIIRKGNLYIINGYKSGDTKEVYDSVMYYYNIDTDTFDTAATQLQSLILTAGKDDNGNYLATFRYGFDAVKNYEATDGVTTVKNSDFFDTYASGGRILPKTNIFSKTLEIGDEVTVKGFPGEENNFGQLWSYSTSALEVIPQSYLAYDENNTVDTDAYASLELIDKSLITNAYVDGFDVSSMAINGTNVYIHKLYLRLYNKNGDELDFADMSGVSSRYYCSGITIEKRMRRFDHIALHHGRIWGTVPTGNMIYASSSDDIFSFSSEDILSKFAVRMPSDSPGTFTGICEYNGEIIAFKESSITVIYGSGVSNYSQSVIYGVGCSDSRSVQVTPEGVIFLGNGGFYLYDGGVPVCISQKLNREYTEAVSGFDGDIYYACVTDGDTKTVLAYDTRYGLWHGYDVIDATGFFRFRNDFYIADSRTVYRTGAGELDTDWELVSVKQYGSTLNNEALSELWIHAEVSTGAYFRVETSVDGGEFREHTVFSDSGNKLFRCPVRAVMGSEFRYRISGSGKVVFYEIEFKSAEGGRRYKERKVNVY